MKSLACPGCGAMLDPSEESKFIICDYCGTTVHNEFYEESEDEEIYLDDVCIELLEKIGKKMARNIPDTQFGTPITGGRMLSEARRNFDIPEEDDVYFICVAGENQDCEQGFALCTSGVHFYDAEDDCGQYTWEEFIDNDVSYEEEVLTIASSSFEVGEHASEVGDFMIELNEQAYNDWYDEEESEEDDGGGEMDLDQLCVERLIERGEHSNVEYSSMVKFGNPLGDEKNVSKLCATLGVPRADDVYLTYDSTLFGSGKTGLALTSSGVYYNAGLLGATGNISWEEFITGPICYKLPKPDDSSNYGTLVINNDVEFSMSKDLMKHFIEFMIDLHNEVYEEYTGKRAPRGWDVVEERF